MYWTTAEYRALARAYDRAFARYDNARRNAESHETVAALFAALGAAQEALAAFEEEHGEE